MHDAIVIGGGPAGSTCAARLAQRGRNVLVLEQAKFPRFHLGESLLPASMTTLDALGALDEVSQRFQRKHGAQFFHDATGRASRYDFADAFDAKYPYAFQVPRDEFDELLLRTAAKHGADVREEWTVSRVVFDGTRAVGVEAKDPSGSVHAFDARVVVDASGRGAMIAHERSETTKIPRLESTALFSQFRGAFRDEGTRAGDILILLADSGWFWFIPFKDGRTSFGAVVTKEWMKTRKPGETVDALFKRSIAESPFASRFLEGAEQLWPAGATADFSFRVRDLAGDGWVSLGDAAGFIDPLFSTGAHVAMTGANLVSTVIDDALRTGDAARGSFEPWIHTMRRGAELFIGAVQAFYEGSLTTYLFAEKPHVFLKRAITSMLAGDVFGADVRWAQELRTRFAPVL